jgi:CRISPR system Cascade subunit CasC
VKHEFDYFTAVDDLARTDTEIEEDAGADMIGDVEFNSACYYKYLSIDRDGFIDNLVGRGLRQEISDADEQTAVDLAASALDALLRAAVLVSPSGKQNSFAAHQLPAAVLVETRPHSSPVSYANAFVKPVARGVDGLVASSLEELGKHVEALTNGFSLKSNDRWLLAPEFSEFSIDGVERVPSLDNLCECLKGAAINA